jgi:hypothetical protein
MMDPHVPPEIREIQVWYPGCYDFATRLFARI